MKQIIATLNGSDYSWTEKSEQSYDDFILGVKKYAEEIKSYSEAQNEVATKAGEKPKYDIKKITEIKIKESDIEAPITIEEYNLLRQKKIDDLKKLKSSDYDTTKEIQIVLKKIIELL